MAQSSERVNRQSGFRARDWDNTMNSYSLGHALADLANGDDLDVNQAAEGGYDQWLAARMNRARRDYDQLAQGSLDPEATLRRWNKALAFARAHESELSPHAHVESGHDVIDLIRRIIHALEATGDNSPFDPYCRECGTDAILVDTHHYCIPYIPEEYDFNDGFGYR